MTTTARGACPHDCPDSCVWEVTVERSEGQEVATRLRGVADHPFTRGELCPKVNKYLGRVYHPDRLLYPAVRTGPKGSGQFERVSWDEALTLVAGRLRQLVDDHGPASVLPYFSAGTQGLLQMASMSERFFNKLGASRTVGGLCGNVALSGVAATQGTGLGIDPEDLRYSRLIILWGTNTLVTNRHLWPVIEEARRGGAEVICIDPLVTPTAAAADWHVQLLPGTDAALALGMMKVIIDSDLVDKGWVGRYTTGFDALKERAAEYPPERVAEICGVSADQIQRLAVEFGTRRPAAIRVLIGMEHRQHGGMAFRTVACLPALVGAWRDRGGGLCRSTGSLFGDILDTTVLTRPDLATAHRRPITMGRLGDALTERSTEPTVLGLVVYNCNPAVVVPNQAKILAGLGRDDLFTVVIEQFMTDTAGFADVVLPATTQLEHLDLMDSWGHLYLTLNQPAIAPRGEALANTEIFRRLSTTMGFDDAAFADSDEDLIRQVLESSTHPFLAGITFDRLQKEASIKLSRPADWRPFEHGGFPTASGRLEFLSPALAARGLDPLPTWEASFESPHGDPALRARYPLACITTKNHVRFLNSSYSQLEAHRRAEGVPRLEIDARDAEARGIIDGDVVRVWNDRGSLVFPARISNRVRPGLVTVPFGWALDAGGGAGCNALTPDADTDMAGGSAFHDTLVQVERAAGE
jgi:anaerobic selenocysteine-containing dehydrogenase